MTDREAITAYPLTWPDGWQRDDFPERNWRFKGHTIASTRDSIIAEIGRMGGKNLIISSNLRLRNDGLPHSTQRMPEDCGVAIYFDYRGESTCLACDKWDKVEHNMHSIARTIYALRQIERDGSSDLLDRAFRGFQALPEPDPWWEVLGVESDATEDDLRRAYHKLARETHPDAGGNAAEFNRVTRAYQEAMAA